MLANILISFIFCAVCTLIFYHTENNGTKTVINNGTFVLLVAAAALVRLWLAAQDYCFVSDVNTFKAWGGYAVTNSFKQLYSMDIFLDYPPGYIYILALMENIRRILNLGFDSIWCTFLYKLPAIAADFACGWLVYKTAKENGTANFAKFCCAAFLFLPAVIFNSSVWGQVESVYLFFVLLSFYFASKDKTVFAAAAYAVALVTKPQAIMFGLVLLFYIVKRRSPAEFVKAALTGLGSCWLLVMPFCQNIFSLKWLIELYTNTMQGYSYFTVNAYNIYYALGLNWKDIDTARFGSINLAVILIVCVTVAFVMLCAKGTHRFFACGAVTVALIFALCTMMHERYLFPAVLMLAMAFAAGGKKIYLLWCGIIGGINFFNSACVMAMYYGGFDLNPKAEKLSGFITTAAVIAFAVTLVRRTVKEMNFDVKKIFKTEYAVAAITVIYAFVAFTGLGSTKAPQTFYQSTEYDNNFVVEFSQPADLGKIYVYSGLGDEETQPYGRKVCGEFEIAVAQDDGLFYQLADVSGLSVYTWKEIAVSAQQVTRVSVSAKSAGAVLHEIVFADTAGNVITGQITDLVIDETNPYTSVNAFDEQHTAPKDTSYYYSMYFDEIYHGRTAYEQLNGMQIYETTHPPLGKIIISLGIVLFGMTPFGWRFAGALCGVVMLPVIYLLAKSAGGKKAGLVATALMAVDFMHLTQTRIATVDTFVVLFCMLTFLFMVCYGKTEFGSRREWLYLLLSGIFMGCTVASKWNGAYPMVALAAVFFIILWGKYKNSGKTLKDRLYTAQTLVFCVAAFVAVPLVIYALSYLPVIHSYTVKDYLRQLVNYQKHMFDYHANLEAEHFFSSVWYTWPLCIKPVWYAVADTANGWVSTISAFGNPLVWIVTPFASAYCLVKGIKTKQNGYLVASLGYFASYIPWVMVTRLCFMYHYFPCAMFGIVCTAIMAKDMLWEKPKSKKLIAVYLAVCLVVFVMFLPVTTGWAAPKGYIEFLEILPQWYFVN